MFKICAHKNDFFCQKREIFVFGKQEKKGKRKNTIKNGHKKKISLMTFEADFYCRVKNCEEMRVISEISGCCCLSFV